MIGWRGKIYFPYGFELVDGWMDGWWDFERRGVDGMD